MFYYYYSHPELVITVLQIIGRETKMEEVRGVILREEHCVMPPNSKIEKLLVIISQAEHDDDDVHGKN